MIWPPSLQTLRALASSASIDPPAGKAATRLLLIEAALLLLAARLLVGRVRFGRWRSLLGTIGPAPATVDSAPTWLDFHLGNVVDRAAECLPLQFKCLPRAMALQWMLARRGRPGTLAFAVLPEARRGTVDDLHAWVELGGQILIGETGREYYPLARFMHGGAASQPINDAASPMS